MTSIELSDEDSNEVAGQEKDKQGEHSSRHQNVSSSRVSAKSDTKKPGAENGKATSLSRKPGQPAENAPASSGVSPATNVVPPAGDPAPGGTVYQKKLLQRQEAIGIKDTVR